MIRRTNFLIIFFVLALSYVQGASQTSGALIPYTPQESVEVRMLRLGLRTAYLPKEAKQYVDSLSCKQRKVESSVVRYTHEQVVFERSIPLYIDQIDKLDHSKDRFQYNREYFMDHMDKLRSYKQSLLGSSYCSYMKDYMPDKSDLFCHFLLESVCANTKKTDDIAAYCRGYTVFNNSGKMH